jgi:SAM-dependent methyltransferase
MAFCIICTEGEKTCVLLFEKPLISSYVCPMTHDTALVDRTALAHARRRADAGRGYFLHDLAIDDVKDRLSFINKSFTSVAIITGTPGPWADAFPDATIVADDDTLALGENAHDLVIHAMALHWANDPVGQLIQCNRSLRPDGVFIGVLLGGVTLHELRTSLAEAEAHVKGGLSPRVLPMGEIRDMGGLLQRAGFALPVADSAVIKTSYATAFDMMRDVRAMGETNAMTARPKTFTSRKVFFKAAEIYAQNYGDDQGRVIASFEQIILTGWAPDASQPKPLRPGSAHMSRPHC